MNNEIFMRRIKGNHLYLPENIIFMISQFVGLFNYINSYDINLSNPDKILKKHSDLITCCAFSSDGQTIVTASRDKTLIVWNSESGVGYTTLTGHTDRVICCAFSPNDQYILSGSADGTLKIWDITNVDFDDQSTESQFIEKVLSLEDMMYVALP